MAPKASKHEWHIGEEHFPAAPSKSVSALAAPVPKPVSYRHILPVVLGVITLLLVFVHLQWRGDDKAALPKANASEAVAQIETPHELNMLLWQPPVDDSTLDASRSSAFRPDAPTIVGLMESGIRKRPAEQVLHVQRSGPLVIETVLVMRAEGTPQWFGPQRIRKFYLRKGDSWQRISPRDLGAENTQELETPHLRFTYQPIDAASIQSVATELEQAYLSIHQILNVQIPPTTEKPTFNVVLRDVAGLISVGATQRIASPSVAQVPHRMTDADYVAQQAVEYMTYMAVRKAVNSAESAYTYRWTGLAWALMGWLQREILGYRAPWHQQAAAQFNVARYGGRNLALNELFEIERTSWPTEEELMTRYMLAESFISYLVDRHGRDKIPALIQGIKLDHTWETLLPFLVDVAADEFERGWNEYLKEGGHLNGS